MPFCPKCKMEHNEDEEYCSKCNKPLDNSFESDIKINESVYTFLMIIIGIVVLGLILFSSDISIKEEYVEFLVIILLLLMIVMV